MTRWTKVRSVALFEFMSTVKRKGYAIATFGMPLFVLLYGGVVSIPGILIAKKEAETKVYGVVDRAGVLRLSGDTAAPVPRLPEDTRAALRELGVEGEGDRVLAQQNAIFRPYADQEQAKEGLLRKEIRGYYLIPADYLQRGHVDAYIGEGNLLDKAGTGRQFDDMLAERLLQGRVPEEIAHRVREPVKTRRLWAVAADGEIQPGFLKGR